MAGEVLSDAHIHIGPGCLGLGLIVTASIEAGLGVHLVARKESRLSSSPRFRAVIMGDRDTKEVNLPVITFSRSDTIENLSAEAREVVSDAPGLLITIAATTKGLEDRHAFLLEIARLRAESAKAETTIFIPCENDPGKSYAELRKKLDSLGVECLDTLVNRLCPELKINSDGTKAEVIADEMAEWVIESGSDHQRALAALGELDYVDFVADVRPYETRKRWLVNGAHLALAIVAHAKRIDSIDVAAAEPGRAQWLEKLHEVLIEPLDSRYPDLSENGHYAKRHVAAWMRHEDEVVRIMRRLRRADPLPFFDDLERKLIEPISLLSNPLASPEVRHVLNRLHRVLQRSRSYIDFEDLPRVLSTLDKSVDVGMASRYRELLVPLMGEEEAEIRAQSLEVSLDFHRIRALSG